MKNSSQRPNSYRTDKSWAKAKRHMNNLLSAAKKRGEDPQEIKDLCLIAFQRNSFFCPYCGGLFDFWESSVDHVIPISKGGAKDVNNRVLCDKRCNQAKGDLTGLQFHELRKKLYELGEDVAKAVLARMRFGGRMFFRKKK